jgi:hypothetical protein
MWRMHDTRLEFRGKLRSEVFAITEPVAVPIPAIDPFWYAISTQAVAAHLACPRVSVVIAQCRLTNLIMASIVNAFLPDISTYVVTIASAAGVPGEHDQHLCMLPDHFRARLVLIRGCGEHTKPTGVANVTSAEGAGAETPGHRAARRAREDGLPPQDARSVMFARFVVPALAQPLTGWVALRHSTGDLGQITVRGANPASRAVSRGNERSRG